ncbi:MAG: hypothetical protein AAF986_08755, partial [Pseudomonadota bacterium]
MGVHYRSGLKKASIWAAGLFGLATLLVACGEQERVAPSQSQAGGAVSADMAAPDGPFAYMRYAVDEAALTPTLCLTFSKPLSPSIDYSAYVGSEVDLTLGVEGSRLCLGGLAYGQETSLTLREGFPASDGEELAREETISLTFDDRPPVVAFAG